MIKRSFFNKMLVSAALIGSLAACQGPGDFLEPQSTSLVTDDVAVSDLRSAEGVLLGTYNSLQSADAYGWRVQALSEVCVDAAYHSGTFPDMAQIGVNQIFANNLDVLALWRRGYMTIYRTNILLERVPGVADEDLPAADKDRIMGEALFIRALAHFDLLRFFGDIPIVTTSVVAENSEKSRSPITDVYAQIESDLDEAGLLLANAGFTGAEAKVRASVDAVNALKARVALYQGNYAEAASNATSVIDGGYSLESDYNNIFEPSNTSSSEVIFQLYADIQDGNSLAFWVLPSSAGGRWEVAPAPDFIFALEDNRDLGDSRYSALLAPHPTEFGEYYFNKFRDINTGTDQPKVLRLAEMYLIRAEARAMQGDLSGAASDLNIIRSRAGLPSASFSDQGDAINQILAERFIELVFEGHRFFDLRRTDKIDEVMGFVNPDGWDVNDRLFPIPQREIFENPNLTQNPGY